MFSNILENFELLFDIDAINYATKYTAKLKQNFPTVTKSILMNQYLNQEHRNSSISLSNKC